MSNAGDSGGVESPPRRGSGLELVLERGAAHVALRPETLLPGVELAALAMEVPDVRLPFDVTPGAAQFRSRLCRLDRLELSIDGCGVGGLLARLDLVSAGVRSVAAEVRDGFVEVSGALEDGAPFTCKVGLVPEGERGVEGRLRDGRAAQAGQQRGDGVRARGRGVPGATHRQRVPARRRRGRAGRWRALGTGLRVARGATSRAATCATRPPSGAARLHPAPPGESLRTRTSGRMRADVERR